MLDFTELPQDGILFEQLVREMLIRSGFEVHWTGVGPDAGRDLVVIERAAGTLAPFSRKWLVSCKHKAHSGASVVMEDVRDITDACGAVDATGFLLVCSTQPASSVVRRFEELTERGALLTAFWDGVEIEKRLNVPPFFPLVHQFFPKSSAAQPWKIFATDSPSVWAAYYKDYFMYLSSRIAHAFPDLTEVAFIASKLEAIELPGTRWESQYLRLRAVNFDDKNEIFAVFVDYIYPRDQANAVIGPDELNAQLKSGHGLHSDGTGSWYTTYWDVKYVPAYTQSDRFHLDSREYYEPYISVFTAGMSRDGWVDEIDSPKTESATAVSRRPRQ